MIIIWFYGLVIIFFAEGIFGIVFEKFYQKICDKTPFPLLSPFMPFTVTYIILSIFMYVLSFLKEWTAYNY